MEGFLSLEPESNFLRSVSFIAFLFIEGGMSFGLEIQGWLNIYIREGLLHLQ